MVTVLTVARDTRGIHDFSDLGKDSLAALEVSEVDNTIPEPASFGYP